MGAAADLSTYRVIRSLRDGRPGAFPEFWNAQAPALWSVLRGTCGGDGEALGFMASFRMDLAETISRFDAVAPLAPQVGRALYDHAVATLGTPMGPARLSLPQDAAGVEALPKGLRFRVLLELFFDAGDALPEDLPWESWDLAAAEGLRSRLSRIPPSAALLLPPGAEPPPRVSRQARTALLILVALFCLGAPALWVWWDRWAWAAIADTRADALSGDIQLGSDPLTLAQHLSGVGVPWLVAEVPDLTSCGLGLVGARVDGAGEVGVVLVYREGEATWTLEHRRQSEPTDGIRGVGDQQVVVWHRDGARWALVGDTLPDRAWTTASCVRDAPSYRAGGRVEGPPQGETVAF